MKDCYKIGTAFFLEFISGGEATHVASGDIAF